jgi:hypothetical protein
MSAPNPPGVPVDPLGLPVDPLGVPVDPLGLPVDPLGLPVDPLGLPVDPLGLPFPRAADGLANRTSTRLSPSHASTPSATATARAAAVPSASTASAAAVAGPTVALAAGVAGTKVGALGDDLAAFFRSVASACRPAQLATRRRRPRDDVEHDHLAAILSLPRFEWAGGARTAADLAERQAFEGAYFRAAQERRQLRPFGLAVQTVCGRLRSVVERCGAGSLAHLTFVRAAAEDLYRAMEARRSAEAEVEDLARALESLGRSSVRPAIRPDANVLPPLDVTEAMLAPVGFQRSGAPLGAVAESHCWRPVVRERAAPGGSGPSSWPAVAELLADRRVAKWRVRTQTEHSFEIDVINVWGDHFLLRCVWNEHVYAHAHPLSISARPDSAPLSPAAFAIHP